MEKEELQAQLEIANLESQKTLRQQQMQFPIEEAESLIKESSISGSLMSLALTDKNSDKRSWLDQGEKERDEVPFLLKRRSQDQRDSSRHKSLSFRNSKSNLDWKKNKQPDRSRLMDKELAIKPFSVTQRLVSPNKAHLTNDFAGNTNVKPKNNVFSPLDFEDFKSKSKYEPARPEFKIEPIFQRQFSATKFIPCNVYESSKVKNIRILRRSIGMARMVEFVDSNY